MSRNNSSKALTDFLSLTGGELVGKIAGFLAFTYLARTLTPEMYGGVELAFVLLGVFTIVVDFGFGPIGSKTISHTPDRAQQISSEILGARILLALASIPLMSIVGLLLDQPINVSMLIVVLSFSLLFSAGNQKWVLQGLEKMPLVSVAQAMKMTVFVLLVVVFVHSENDLVKIGFIEIIVCITVASFFLFLQKYYLGTISLTLSASKLKPLFSQAKFIGGSNLVWSLTMSLPAIILAAAVGATEVAWFGAAFRITNALMSFSMIYHFNMYPTVTSRLKISPVEYSKYSRPSVRITAWGGIFIAFLITLLAEPLCVFVFGEPYAASSLTLAILIWIIPISILSGHARWVLVAENRQHQLLIASLLGCITCLVAGFILIPLRYSAGAAIAVVFSFLIVWLSAHYFASKHVVSIPIKPMLIPVVVAAVLLAAGYVINEHSFFSASILTVAFIVSGFFLDNRLRQDVPELIKIKSNVNAN